MSSAAFPTVELTFSSQRMRAFQRTARNNVTERDLNNVTAMLANIPKVICNSLRMDDIHPLPAPITKGI